MTTLETRQFVPADLEVRSAGDGRTVHGIAVPFGIEQRINEHLVEQFDLGVFAHQVRAANRVRFSREHIDLGGSLIGATTMLREEAKGLYWEARASRTPLGDETLELIKDGALTHLSVAFRSRPRGSVRLPSGVVARRKADLIEVAVVLEGAYGDAARATGVRSADQLDEVDEVCCTHCRATRGASSNREAARRIAAGIPVLPPAV
ncbi:HK97 family phage prohead protease [Actinoplanes sp. NPDC051861]|uniref:HK97 family phage prohead protease n=1 Tax=Actinoplanes sp. NPDC051861 TaxID=3155170 RepID=UPI00342A8464